MWSHPFSHHVIIVVWGLFWWFLVARRPLEALGKRVSQSPLENHPSVIDSVYLDAYVLWSEDRDHHFLLPFLAVPPSEASGFKLVFLKEKK